MNLQQPARRRVVVIGGGITGLAAAHRLLEVDPALEVSLVEASDRLGGVLKTVRRDGFLIEESADNFITNTPWAVDLCRRIGLAEQLIPTARQRRNAMVVCRGQLEKVPQGFMLLAPARVWPILSSPILSLPGKLRLLAERWVPQRSAGSDESLASFARRRLGREAFERIVQPLVGGIYTADPERLSLAATLPRFLEMEQQCGSLTRGARQATATSEAAEGEPGAGARYGLFVTPRDGMTSLVEALAVRLPPASVHLNSPVAKLTRTANGAWNVELAPQDGPARALECEGLIVTAPAPVAGKLLAPCSAALGEELAGIEYAGTAIVTLGYRRSQIKHPLDGFGFVVPAIEKRQILAGSFSSVKFPGRAPDDSVLVRVFIGGACQGELMNLSDDELRTIAARELAALLGVQGRPLFADVARWPASMPQYHLGHLERVARIDELVGQWPNLALAGNAYRGVGIPHCIHSGQQAAERIAAALKTA